MGQCIGYGKFKGACPNCTAENGSPVFCPRCAELRKEELEKRKIAERSAEQNGKNYHGKRVIIYV